jgi:hypothetical protein
MVLNRHHDSAEPRLIGAAEFVAGVVGPFALLHVIDPVRYLAILKVLGKLEPELSHADPVGLGTNGVGFARELQTFPRVPAKFFGKLQRYHSPNATIPQMTAVNAVTGVVVPSF